MKHPLLISASCLLLAGPVLSEESDWAPLSNGKDLDAWQQVNGTAKYWIEDDSIVGQTREGSPNSFLATRKLYGDFELKFEVLVHDKLNSGVQIRSLLQQDPKGIGGYGRLYGPQVEITSNPGKSGYIYGEATKWKWLSTTPKSKNPSVEKHTHFKPNEWNSYHIIANGPRIQTFINGNLIEDLTHEDIYKTNAKGVIGLQVHSIGKGSGPYEVRWRKLMTKAMD